MSKKRKEFRDRLIMLAFASIFLMLAYGPAARWFVAADRAVYDQLARHLANAPLADAVIVSIDPARKSPAELLAEYGRLIRIVKDQAAQRVILPQPPSLPADEALPEWAATLTLNGPVFVPRRHRLALSATKSGFVEWRPDDDGVLRRAQLWMLIEDSMTPSLALAAALADPARASDPRLSTVDDTIFLSNYTPVSRIAADDVLDGRFSSEDFSGKTVFIDAHPALAAAAATLPSDQYVTHSEVTAAILADMEDGRAILTPGWVNALQWLVPAFVAVVVVLLLPGRKRRGVLTIAATLLMGLLLMEAALLFALRVRIDLGRAMLLVIGAGAMLWWLCGSARKITVSSYKRGADFLAAGRLEPAFAELRRCEPTETVASAMYKLSLAFEEKAQPERAEAVLDWLKRTDNGQGQGKPLGEKVSGVPERLGRYVIERKLGRGAMGAVYLARDPRINRPVALKVIPLEKEFEDEELKEARIRFFREAESAGRLAHPNIVTVYDAGEDQHLAYIAMEYLQGTPLTRFTDPKKLLAPNKALELCARTAEALDYAHNQGIIHRDIKPANILYNLRDDALKISDFGVARMTDNNRTKTGIVLGTPMYMSPEQLNAEDLTGHSDLFSLGVTLYELLTGEVPFKANNIAVLMTRITTEDPTPVSNRRAGVPPSVDSVLLKALAKRPENRFANGAEMAIALRNCARYAS